VTHAGDTGGDVEQLWCKGADDPFGGAGHLFLIAAEGGDRTADERAPGLQAC
jgi:hypothetical protein